MGLFGALFKVAAALVLALIGIGAYLWFTDYAVEATVTQTGEDSGGDYVIITPALAPYDFKQYLDQQSATFVCEGYDVTYRIQTEHYQVFDREGRLVYDSEQGLTNAFSPLRCALLG